jgi:protein CpxP
MKQNKLNLFAILALGGVMVCAPIARADDAAPATPATPPAKHAGGGQMELIKSLDLTPEQQPKVKEFMKAQREKMSALRDDTSLTKDQRQAKIKEIMDAGSAKMKEILTPDQFTKWEAGRKNMHAAHEPKAAATVPDLPTKAN